MRAMDLGVELGAKIFVFWGGREGTETDACRRAGRCRQAAPRGDRIPLRLSEAQGTAKIRARSQAERAARRHLHGDYRDISASSTLDHPEMVGVNPEVAHERWRD